MEEQKELAFSYMQRDWPTAPNKEGLTKDVKDIIRAIDQIADGYLPLVRQFATREGANLDPTEWVDKRHFHFSREAALTITKLDEARMWAEEMLKVLEQE